MSPSELTTKSYDCFTEQHVFWFFRGWWQIQSASAAHLMRMTLDLASIRPSQFISSSS